MAMLSPITACKVNAANAFLTSLYSNMTNLVSSASVYYNNPSLTNITFLRNEQLSKVVFSFDPSIGQEFGYNSYNKLFTISLNLYKSVGSITTGATTTVNITSHGFSAGNKIRFSGTTMPTGMFKGRSYYAGQIATNSFVVYDTQANAIAGGSTGLIATSGTSSTLVCHKSVEEKTNTMDSLFNFVSTDGIPVGNMSTNFCVSLSGWTTVIDTTASKWSFLFSTDDSTSTSSGGRWLSGGIACFGTTTASAVSGTDTFMLDAPVDFSPGWNIAGVNFMASNPVWENNWKNPYFIVDPTASSLGTLTYNASSQMWLPSSSGYCFGKYIEFTGTILSGATSATLSSNFTGVSGSYVVQLVPLGEEDTYDQVTMAFTNGSASVTFSAVTSNYKNFAGICHSKARPLSVVVSSTNLTIAGGTGFSSNCCFIMLAENTRKSFGYLVNDVATGSSSIVVDRETGWQVGDKIYIGGNIARGVNATDDTVYTINAISSSGGQDTIGLSANIATYNRINGGCVLLNSSALNGINLSRTTGSATFAVGYRGEFTFIAGIDANFINASDSFGAVVSHSLRPAESYKGNFLFNLYNYTGQLYATLGGSRMDDVALIGSIGTIFASPSYEYKYQQTWKNIINLRYGSSNTMNTYGLVYFKNIYVETKFSGGGLNNGIRINLNTQTRIDGFKLWNTATLIRGLLLSGFNYDADSVKNIYIDACTYGIVPEAGSYKAKNIYFGTKAVNTYDLQCSITSAFCDAEFNNPQTNPTVDKTYVKIGMFGSKVRLTDINGTAGFHRTIHKYGETTMTGAGLSDTTLHGDNPCLRMQSSSGLYTTYFDQTIPTGNIQNKDMSLGVWVKIDNSAYWAGVNQMPRLTVTYDKTSVVYAEAGQVTGWQFLSVPFRPTTTTGYIKVVLSIASDAGLTNSTTYFADISVLYPAGYTLNLGVFNNTSGGEPVTPTISTSVSALDVWAADPSQFGANTVGDKVNKIKTDTGLIPALL